MLRSDFAALLGVCEILRNVPEASRYFCTDSFRSFLQIFLYNFHFLLVFNHSCNSLARKYPRKGKLPSYINSLASTVRGGCNHVIYVIHRSIYRIYRALLCFSFSFIFHFHFLSSQPNFEDFSTEDERLGFLSLRVRKAG